LALIGTLYIVATPIGNLEDLSPRAARILGEVDLIACEDTRQTRKLLDHLKLHKPMVSLHEHNEQERTGELIGRLEQGVSIALVSDAGTPAISDPGYRLIHEAAGRRIPVSAIPGPNAAITALCASGLPTDAFFFAGFFAHKRTQRIQQLQKLKELPATLIFYETPHRILDALEDIQTVLGARPVVVGRELTKLHEEYLRGTALSIHAMLSARAAIRGEFTVLVGKAAPDRGEAGSDVASAVGEYVGKGLSRMDAIKAVARDRDLPKREVYRMLEEKQLPK
jgi:16S rRNA (cytidine1402-2'-O)-methyltransferase